MRSIVSYVGLPQFLAKRCFITVLAAKLQALLIPEPARFVTRAIIGTHPSLSAFVSVGIRPCREALKGPMTS